LATEVEFILLNLKIEGVKKTWGEEHFPRRGRNGF
jgi:hypothetical protein